MKKKQFLIDFTYYLCTFAFLTYWGIRYALPVLLPFLLALAAALLLRGPSRWLFRQMRLTERMCSPPLLLLFYLLLFGGILLFGVQAVSSAGRFAVRKLQINILKTDA